MSADKVGREARHAHGTVGFHVTPARNVTSILKRGLLPRIGWRSKRLGETAAAVYVFRSLEAVEDALVQWLGDAFPETTRLAVIAADVHGRAQVDGGTAGFELAIAERIPPECLRVISGDVGSVLDLRSLLAGANGTESAAGPSG